jgi:transcriptional regulator with XRE-family HTH domain
MSKTSLDISLIQRLRSQRGLSQRGLGLEVGVTPAIIHRIENGEGHGDLSVHQVAQLAAALGVAPRTLFIEETVAERTTIHPEVAIVEAALATAAVAASAESLAAALSWSLDRTINALESLDQHLQGTGIRLNRTSNGYALGPRNLLTEEESSALGRLALRTGKARASSMRILLAAVREPLDGEWERRAGNAERVDRGMLQNAGLLEQTARGLEPSAIVKKSLGLAEQSR